MLMCRHCGEVNPARARFCFGCGTALASEALPVEVRRVSVLFADIAGSTALITGTDPDRAQAMLDGVVSTMREAIHRFGGVVTRVAGDGIVALFGAPDAAEDHACRACWAALRMLSDMSHVRVNAGRSRAGSIRIRIGINSGDALLRSVSTDLHQEYSAEGETTHLAAKAQQAAAPGTALVTAEVARLVEGFVQTQQHEPLVLTGLAQPVALFKLVSATLKLASRLRWSGGSRDSWVVTRNSRGSSRQRGLPTAAPFEWSASSGTPASERPG
jgi:class 3 adenylate cyclase